MGVPGDEEFRVHGLDFLHRPRIVAARIAADVGHQHPDALAFEGEELGVDAARQSAVDVAAHGFQRFEGGDPVGQLDRADVARVPEFVDVPEEIHQGFVEGAVGVG